MTSVLRVCQSLYEHGDRIQACRRTVGAEGDVLSALSQTQLSPSRDHYALLRVIIGCQHGIIAWSRFEDSFVHGFTCRVGSITCSCHGGS
ncbi:hypothetical protein JZ751_026851 [Albula glossodonta]|uniref:Uncharacterized protein n=1 Tax=Albula glossodonta TaxID=121402 RepID=A0A8T2PD80_9TELE|nr:hypothetical protein JZ751_026851 [Albula glossodonta]